ncbi:MAG: substrate-binding domain-containing protein, partial [Anaerolineae bacterium]|nr:substrate-binding domain-containing protein [Anaerolineae bacterium]
HEKHFCEIVLGRGVDGVIMVPVHLTDDDLDHYVSQSRIPFVALAQYVTHPSIDVVFVNDERAIYEATQWLIEAHEHTRVGYIGVPDHFPPGPRRFRGYSRAMRDAGLSINPRYLREGDFTMDGGAAAIQSLVESGDMPSALIIVNDLMAIGAILALQEAGYNVPDDVAVVGFDDIREATIVRPTLTTIAQDPRDIGEKLARALFERIENPNINEKRIFESSYRLIQRQST